MKPFRILALATLLTLACSRDRSDTAADSLGTMQPNRPATDTMTRAPVPPDTTASSDSMLTGSRITVERAVVNGLLWGAPEADARRLLGAPQSQTTVWEEALGDSATVMNYPGMTVNIVERRVVGVHCTAQSCITGDAVRVGATRSELEQVYGKGQQEGTAANPVLAYPFTTDDSCALRFELGQGKVRAIDVSCQMN
jgi:hypothetical protein